MSLLEQAKLSEQPPYASWVTQHISDNIGVVSQLLYDFMNTENPKLFESDLALIKIKELEGVFKTLELNAVSELLLKWIEILENKKNETWEPNSFEIELLVKTCFVLKDQNLRLEDGQNPPLSPVMGLLKELNMPIWTYEQFNPLFSKILPKFPDLKVKRLELEKYFERTFEYKGEDEYENLKYFVWNVLKAPQTNLEIDFLKRYHLTQYWSSDEYFPSIPITEAAITFSSLLNIEINNIKDEIDTWIGKKEINSKNLNEIVEKTLEIQACLQTVGIQERESKIGMAIELLKRFQHNPMVDKQILLTIAHIFERIQEINLDIMLLGVEKTKESPGRRHALKTLNVIKQEALIETKEIHLAFKNTVENKTPIAEIKPSLEKLSGLMEILGISKVHQYLEFIISKIDSEIPIKTIANVIAITDATIEFLNTNAPFLEDLKVAIHKKQPTVAQIIQKTNHSNVPKVSQVQIKENIIIEKIELNENKDIAQSTESASEPLIIEKNENLIEDKKNVETINENEILIQKYIYELMGPYWLSILKDGSKCEKGINQLKNILNLLNRTNEVELLTEYLTTKNKVEEVNKILEKYILMCQVKEKTIFKIQNKLNNMQDDLRSENWEAIYLNFISLDY